MQRLRFAVRPEDIVAVRRIAVRKPLDFLVLLRHLWTAALANSPFGLRHASQLSFCSQNCENAAMVCARRPGVLAAKAIALLSAIRRT